MNWEETVRSWGRSGSSGEKHNEGLLFESDKTFYGCTGFQAVAGNPSGKSKFEKGKSSKGPRLAPPTTDPCDVTRKQT